MTILNAAQEAAGMERRKKTTKRPKPKTILRLPDLEQSKKCSSQLARSGEFKRVVLASIICLFRTHRNLWLENLALRQQLAVLKRKHPRPRLTAFDKLFWVLAQTYWPRWKQALIVVSPETVVRWRRTGFQMYWSWLSRHQICFGRKRISRELRELICKMAAENPSWGAPRIHGELQMLGFDVAERTVSRWVQKAPRDPEKRNRWKAFLKNHREAIAAMDFFTVHTVTFGILYCFFLIAHDRRRILHFNVTRNGKQAQENFIPKPLAEWSCRALGGELPPRFARSCDRAQREAPETPSQRIRPLLSRRPHTSRTRQGDSRWEGAICVGWPGHRALLVGLRGPPLRPSCVEKRETKTFQREISVQVRLFASTEARGALPGPFLCCWFPARNNSSSDSESRRAFWRTTT